MDDDENIAGTVVAGGALDAAFAAAIGRFSCSHREVWVTPFETAVGTAIKMAFHKSVLDRCYEQQILEQQILEPICIIYVYVAVYIHIHIYIYIYRYEWF